MITIRTPADLYDRDPQRCYLCGSLIVAIVGRWLIVTARPMWSAVVRCACAACSVGIDEKAIPPRLREGLPKEFCVIAITGDHEADACLIRAAAHSTAWLASELYSMALIPPRLRLVADDEPVDLGDLPTYEKPPD